MEDRMLRHLRDGLSFLEQPYSVSAGMQLHAHLDATPDELDSKDMLEINRCWSRQKPGACIVQVLQVFDQYLEWLLPAYSSSHGATSNNSSKTPLPTGDQVYVHVGCIVDCLLQVSSQLYSAQFVGDATAAAVGAHLLKPRTATLSLLTGITELAMAKPADHSRHLLAGPLCMGWAVATQLAYPLTTRPNSSSSGSSSSSSSGGSSSSSSVWIEAPQLRRGLPAVAALMHWQLQQPLTLNLSGQDASAVATLVRQVQLRVQAAAAPAAAPAAAAAITAAGASQVATSSKAGLRANQQQQQQGWLQPDRTKTKQKQSHKAQLQQGKGKQDTLVEAWVLAGPAWKHAWEQHMPQSAREQVEGFLWGALAAATAALQEAANSSSSSTSSSSTSRPAQSSTNTTITTSSSSSKRGTPPPSWLPQGAGYRGLDLTQAQAKDIASQAAATLLQLAGADVPEQHLPPLTSAAAWVSQQPLSMSLGSVMGKLAAELAGGKRSTGRSKAGSAGAPASGGNRSKQGVGRSSSSKVADSAQGGVNRRTPHPLILCVDMCNEFDTRDQMRELAAAGYLCWPGSGTAGGGSITGAGSSSSSSNRSSSQEPTTSHGATISTGSGGGSSSEASGITCDQLQMLAVAVDATWWSMPNQHPLLNPSALQASEQCVEQFYVVAQLLLLLTQQLQGVPPQLRAAFLHSPQGSRVLQVLTEMSSRHMRELCLTEVLMHFGPQAAAAAAAAAVQQVQPAAPGWVNHWAQGNAVVELLLLPGLLLAPVSELAPSICDDAAHVSSSTPGCCSIGGKQLQAVSNEDGASSSSGGSARISSASSSSMGNMPCAELPPAPAPAAAASGPQLAVALQGALAPLVLVPHGALQLPPGCVPPPAAFFLVEQRLRDWPSRATLSLAVKLLRGCVSTITAHQPQVQQQATPNQQQSASSVLHGRQAAAAELAVLAYCSLATSVVQVVVSRHGKLVEGCEGELLALASDLAHAALALGPGASSGDSRSSSAGSRLCAVNSSERDLTWGLPASLAAAVAAGAYHSHYHLQQQQQQQQQAGEAACQAQQQLHGRAPAGEEVEAGDSSSQTAAARSSVSADSTDSSVTTAATTTTTSSSSSSTASQAGCRAAAEFRLQGGGVCAGGCGTCRSATRLFTTLRRLERGMGSPPISKEPAAAGGGGLLVKAAQQQCMPPQQLLHNQLLAIAWRHPVPGVCGNVLCKRQLWPYLPGPAAVGAVRGRVGSLCGGCRAAWYCCEGCQQIAWPVHKAMCKRSCESAA